MGHRRGTDASTGRTDAAGVIVGSRLHGAHEILFTLRIDGNDGRTSPATRFLILFEMAAGKGLCFPARTRWDHKSQEVGSQGVAEGRT